MELKVESGEVRGEEQQEKVGRERERAPTRVEKKPPSVFGWFGGEEGETRLMTKLGPSQERQGCPGVVGKASVMLFTPSSRWALRSFG